MMKITFTTLLIASSFALFSCKYVKKGPIDPTKLSGQSVRYIEGTAPSSASNKPISNEEYVSILVSSGFFRLKDDDTTKQLIREILNSKVIVEISSPSDNGSFSFIREVGNDLTSEGSGFLRFANLPLFEQKYLNLPSLRISIRFYTSSKEGVKKISDNLPIIKELEKSPQYQIMASLYHVGLRLLDIDFEKPLIDLDFALSLSNANIENATCNGAADVLCEGYLLLTEANSTVRVPENVKYGNEGLCVVKDNTCETWRETSYLVLKIKRHVVPGTGNVEKDIQTIDGELLNAMDRIRQPNLDLLETTIFGLSGRVSDPHLRMLRGLLSLAKWLEEYYNLKQLTGDQWVRVKADLLDALKRYKSVSTSLLLTGSEKEFLRSTCGELLEIQALLKGLNEGLKEADLPICK